jgi:hypothetical protein
VSRLGRTLPPAKSRYPLYRRLGGPQGRSGQVRKISSPPGFDPRTVQPVSSRYTDYATRPTCMIVPYLIFLLVIKPIINFWIRETGTGQQVAQLRDRYMMIINILPYSDLLIWIKNKIIFTGTLRQTFFLNFWLFLVLYWTTLPL